MNPSILPLSSQSKNILYLSLKENIFQATPLLEFIFISSLERALNLNACVYSLAGINFALGQN